MYTVENQRSGGNLTTETKREAHLNERTCPLKHLNSWCPLSRQGRRALKIMPALYVWRPEWPSYVMRWMNEWLDEWSISSKCPHGDNHNLRGPFIRTYVCTLQRGTLPLINLLRNTNWLVLITKVKSAMAFLNGVK